MGEGGGPEQKREINPGSKRGNAHLGGGGGGGVDQTIDLSKKISWKKKVRTAR